MLKVATVKFSKYCQYASKASLFNLNENILQSLSQESKYSMRFKNVNKFFKISLALNDYIIDVKIKKGWQ